MTDDIANRLRAQKTTQQIVEVWKQKNFIDKLADFEYVVGYRELMFQFIKSKNLSEEWMEYFHESGRLVVVDDIVTRLRAEFDACTCSGFNDCGCERCHKRPKCDLYDLVGQAASEIERLRKAGDALAQGIRAGHWDTALEVWDTRKDA